MRWLLSWAFYGVGDLVSKPMSEFDCCAGLHPLYNWLMTKSVEIQGDGKGPWEKA